MSLVALTNIEKTFGERTLFHGLNLNVEQGERVGLIGANGSGKSTLFGVIMGTAGVDSGTVARAKNARIGMLAQDPVFDPANSVMDEAELAFSELHALAHQLRDIEHEMAHLEGEALDKKLDQYQNVQHEFDLAGGYAWQHKLEATLLGVGLTRETWEQNVQTLSGGQRSRLALAKLLISEPDVLLLDEPTNHLDLTAIEWLEKYLATFAGAVVLISHDRYLLDRLATRIVWLVRTKISSYPGNYSAFVAQREVQELTQARQYERQQADIEKQQEFIRRFGAGQRAREAAGREKKLNRFLQSDELVQKVDSAKNIKLSIDTDQRAGDQVLQVRELTKSFGDKLVWSHLKFDVKRGERIGIIGPNGSGKTTLLRTLLGEEDATAGTVRWGASLNIGYYDQRLGDFNPDHTIAEAVTDGRIVKDQLLRDTLASLLFRGDDIHKPVRLLSGGERARVRLAQLLLDKPNVLLLDEPTNHLDIASCEALEGSLSSFPGTVFCVSHDRYFLNKVAGRLLVLDPPNLVDFNGNYAEWARKQSNAPAPKPAASTPPKPAPPAPPPVEKPAAAKKDNPYKRPFGRLSVKELEKEIAAAESAIAAANQAMADPQNYKNAAKAQELQRVHDRAAERLKALEAEYFARET